MIQGGAVLRKGKEKSKKASAFAVAFFDFMRQVADGFGAATW